MNCFANMDPAAAQYCAICYCVKLQKSAAETVWMMKEAYNDQV